MTEVAADPRRDPAADGIRAKVRKFPCESCGAAVVWSPGTRTLECRYCGSRRELPRTSEEIRERALHDALGEPHDLGWGAERKVFQCRKCGARTTVESGHATAACAFCATPAVVEIPANATMVRPEGLLPFTVDRNAAIGKFRAWLGGLWFRPNDLQSRSGITKIQGVYIPFWTFDAATHSAWTAEAGHYYYESVRRTRNGRTVTERARRVRWEPAAGTLEKFFDDVPIPASRGLEEDLCREIQPFPTGSLVAYDPRYLSGFLAEENAVDLHEAWGLGKQRMKNEIKAACAAQVPGDTHRNLSVDSSFDGVAYKNALLPVWIAAYGYGGETFRFLVNGVTGKISGRAPLSWAKIAMLGIAIVAAVLLFVIVAGG